jgi:hypothetical protein
VSDFLKKVGGSNRYNDGWGAVRVRPQKKPANGPPAFRKKNLSLTPILGIVAASSRLIINIVAFHCALLRTSGTGLARLARAAAVRLLTALLAGLTGALRIIREIA